MLCIKKCSVENSAQLGKGVCSYLASQKFLRKPNPNHLQMHNDGHSKEVTCLTQRTLVPLLPRIPGSKYFKTELKECELQLGKFVLPFGPCPRGLSCGVLFFRVTSLIQECLSDCGGVMPSPVVTGNPNCTKCLLDKIHCKVDFISTFLCFYLCMWTRHASNFVKVK